VQEEKGSNSVYAGLPRVITTSNLRDQTDAWPLRFPVVRPSSFEQSEFFAELVATLLATQTLEFFDALFLYFRHGMV